MPTHCVATILVFDLHFNKDEWQICVRRAQAEFLSGRKSHPKIFAPAGSNLSSYGGNEVADSGVFDVDLPDAVGWEGFSTKN